MVTSFSTYSGGAFLVFYFALIVAAVAAGLWISHVRRPDGRAQDVSDPSELAVLASGPGRFAEMVLARLYGEGIIKEGGANNLAVAKPGEGQTESERAVSSTTGEFAMTDAFKTLKPYAEDIERQLIERELLIDKGGRFSLRMLAVLPFVAVLAVGFYRQQAGEALGESTTLLEMLMVLTAVLGIWRFSRFDPRTRAGQNAIDKARERSSRLQSAPTQSELGLGVALFGTAILAGTPYSQLHAMRQSSSSEGSASGCTSDGGGGGCGGCGG